ncbi:leucine-rich repeat-containing protein 53-like [Anolis carolinensis]|uniref:leucine-rich repeat-containing protein 53-like n=1 Tax=Anolis carolinensis TaxID=28377 RepID=UPI002F2B57C8
MQAKLEGHSSRQNDQCGLLARNKSISPQLDNFLICKYTDCDKFQDYLTAGKENQGKNLRLEKEQSEVKRRRAVACFTNDEEVPLSPAMKRMYQPKCVSFYVPDQVTVKREDVKTRGLNEKRSLEDKPQHKSIQRSPSTTLERRLLNNSEAKDKGRQSFPTPLVPEEKEAEFTLKHKRKTKGQDSLMVKLNLHPFRKARIHPEEPIKENTDECPHCQHLQLPHISKKEEANKKRKRKSDHSVASLEISGNSKQIIYSAVAAGEMAGKTDENAVASISDPHSKNISAMKITEGTSSSKHSQTLSCGSRSPTFSPNGTSGMTVSITALSSNHSPNISQNAANNIPTSVNSKKEDAIETEVMPFHQNEAKEEDCSFSSSLFSLAENCGFQNSGNEDNLKPQEIVDNVVQNMNLEQLNQEQLKRQDESLTVKDEMEGHKRTGESEPLKGDLVNRASHSSGEKTPSNGHWVSLSREEDKSRVNPPVHVSSAIFNFQANEFLTNREEIKILHRDKDMEECGTKELKTAFKSENVELTKMFVPNTSVDPLGLEKELLTENEWENNKYNTLLQNTVKVTIISNKSSVPSSPETRNTHMDNNVNPEMKNNVCIVNKKNLQEVPDNQLDEGISKYKEGKMPPATCQEDSLLPQFKDVSYEEQNETSLLTCNTNKAEVSIPQPTLSTTYTDYDKESPLQMEQRKANISNNTHPSLVLFKDKKPFSI